MWSVEYMDPRLVLSFYIKTIGAVTAVPVPLTTYHLFIEKLWEPTIENE